MTNYLFEYDEVKSAEALKELFEGNDGPCLSTIERYGVDDVVALRTAFEDWKDSLHRAGVISKAVCDNTIYVHPKEAPKITPPQERSTSNLKRSF